MTGALQVVLVWHCQLPCFSELLYLWHLPNRLINTCIYTQHGAPVLRKTTFVYSSKVSCWNKKVTPSAIPTLLVNKRPHDCGGHQIRVSRFLLPTQGRDLGSSTTSKVTCLCSSVGSGWVVGSPAATATSHVSSGYQSLLEGNKLCICIGM